MLRTRISSVAAAVIIVLGSVGASAAPPVTAQTSPDSAEMGPSAGQTRSTGDPCTEVPPPPPERPTVDADGNPVDAQGDPIPPPPPDYPADYDPDPGDTEVDCQRAFRMRGGADELVIDAIVCDISKPFTVTGSNISIDFLPKGTDPLSGGKYTYFGDFGDFQLAGNGTYKLKLKGTGGSIVAKGPGKAITPRGTFTNKGTERYKLTPASCP